jgi:DNA replication and repair protein RecF
VDYEPCPGLNIILGNNAQGKTSILEAIFVLATGYTFRKTSDINLINYEKDFFTIQANYSIGESTYDARLDYNRNGSKILKINNKKSQFKHQDRLKMVLFTPDDLFLVKGPPGRRRAFLDFMLRQISAEYSYNMDDFSLTLRKRNLFLKNDQTKSKAFNIINALFVEKACSVIIQRLSFVSLLDDFAAQTYKKINDGKDELRTRYALSFNIDGGDKINTDVLQRAMVKQMNEGMKRKLKLIFLSIFCLLNANKGYFRDCRY